MTSTAIVPPLTVSVVDVALPLVSSMLMPVSGVAVCPGTVWSPGTVFTGGSLTTMLTVSVSVRAVGVVPSVDSTVSVSLVVPLLAV